MMWFSGYIDRSRCQPIAAWQVRNHSRHPGAEIRRGHGQRAKAKSSKGMSQRKPYGNMAAEPGLRQEGTFGFSIGMFTVKVVPFPFLLSTSIEPACSCMIL